VIVRQTRFYRLAELFFDEEGAPPAVDVVEYFQRSQPRPERRARNREFHTLHIDLEQDPELLFSTFSKNCRYKIRRAEREGFEELTWSPATPAKVDEFVAFCERSSVGKGLPPAPAERLHALCDADLLDLSAVTCHADPLVWHANLRAQGRARLLHSASLYREIDDTGMRNRVGRANRYLHWRDLLQYQQIAVPLYDFGGWYQGRDDQELLRINAFKEEFGGRHVREFHAAVPITLRGRAVLRARDLRHH